jgi:hypothetical protein
VPGRLTWTVGLVVLGIWVGFRFENVLQLEWISYFLLLLLAVKYLSFPLPV